MKLKKMMFDGYAGFGGQSESFLRAGWEVLRIDNNPLLADVERMVIMDLRSAEPFNLTNSQVEYAHFSPPCLAFSMAYNSPRSKAIRAGTIAQYERDIDMTDVLNSIRIIQALKPRFWSLENVRGGIKFIEPLLGKPRLIVGSWCYWGNFPMFDISHLDIPTKETQDHRHSPLRANYRAHIPECISTAFLNAISSQTSILNF